MEQKGEFEQRPEIKPADQISLPKAKASPLPWILCAILTVAVIGLGIFIAVNGVGGEKKENNDSGSTTAEEKKPEEKSEEGGGNPSTEVPKVDIEAEKAEVSGIFEELKAAIIKQADDTGLGLYEIVDESGMLAYEFEKGYSTTLDFDYGLTLKQATDELKSYSSKISNNQPFLDKLIAILQKHGLEQTQIDDGRYWVMDYYYYFANDDGVFCKFPRGDVYYPFRIACGHKDWISDEKKQLIKELVDAVKKVSISDNGGHPWFIELIPGRPVTKKNGYEVLWALEPDVPLIFYREEGGEWIFFEAPSGLVDCDRYDTDEKKAAFEGERCYDLNTHKESVVKR